jgi:hypothetical protein
MVVHAHLVVLQPFPFGSSPTDGESLAIYMLTVAAEHGASVPSAYTSVDPVTEFTLNLLQSLLSLS